jgi:hypothetical protein
LEWCKSHCSDHTRRVWPGSPAQFRSALKAVLKREGLSSLRYSLGSCRPGGATFRFMKGESVERLQFQGRWASTSSLKSYIQESMAWVCWSIIPPRIESYIRFSIWHFSDALAQPPPLLLSPLSHHGKESRSGKQLSYG